MTNVAGIEVEIDIDGNPIYVRVDLNEHGKALKPFLTEMGVLEKDWFDSEFEEGLTGDELRKKLNKSIDKMFKTPPTTK